MNLNIKQVRNLIKRELQTLSEAPGVDPFDMPDESKEFMFTFPVVDEAYDLSDRVESMLDRMTNDVEAHHGLADERGFELTPGLDEI